MPVWLNKPSGSTGEEGEVRKEKCEWLVGRGPRGSSAFPGGLWGGLAGVLRTQREL